jgi:hypothetical protein
MVFLWFFYGYWNPENRRETPEKPQRETSGRTIVKRDKGDSAYT